MKKRNYQPVHLKKTFIDSKKFDSVCGNIRKKMSLVIVCTTKHPSTEYSLLRNRMYFKSYTKYLYKKIDNSVSRAC